MTTPLMQAVENLERIKREREMEKMLRGEYDDYSEGDSNNKTDERKK